MRVNFLCLSARVLIAALFSATAASAVAATVAVTSTEDTAVPGDHKVTLREAITAINAGSAGGDADITAQNPGTFGTGDTIAFNIAGGGVQTISANSLPALSKQVFINGYSQPGSTPNTNALNAGINAKPLIQISGDCAYLYFARGAEGSIVRGLVLSNIDIGASNITVAGNFIGTDASGAAATTGAGSCGSYTGSAVFVTPYLSSSSDSQSIDNLAIGGPNAADRNLLAGISFLMGINSSKGHLVQGNYIGPDASGTSALGGNGGRGIDRIANARILGNLISGNRLSSLAAFDHNVIQGNLIGTQRDGISPLANGTTSEQVSGGGIILFAGDNLVGGTGVGEANIIALNNAYGVFNATYTSALLTHNRISGNSIYGNLGRGIVLYYQGPPANDTGDGDASEPQNQLGNDGQNYPVITLQSVSGNATTVSGTLNSLANGTYTLEFFANPDAERAACGQRGYGNGRTYIGTKTVNTDASGNASFGPLTFTIPAGQTVISSTATDSVGNTSEFSYCTATPTTSTLPTAQPLTVATSFNTATSFTLIGSDANPGGPYSFTFAVVSQPTHGVLSLGNAGLTSYTPNDGYQGVDSFSYSVSDANGTSPAATVTITVAGPQTAATTTTLSAAPSTANQGQLVAFTATVVTARTTDSVGNPATAAQPQATAPSGTVHFSEGGTALADVALNGGGAAYSTANLTVGPHTITATYSGDANNAGSSGSANVTINAVAPPAASVPAPALPMWGLIVLCAFLALCAAVEQQRRNRGH